MKGNICLKSILRRASTLALGLLVLASVGINAARVTAVTVELRPNVTILVDDTERTFYNAQGQEVHPIYHDGTHYLPIRAIGELMGKNVNWDQESLTITLAGERTTGAVTGTTDASARVRNIMAELRPDFTIVVDDARRTFADEQGRTVYPMLHEGTTYLPVRAIGTLMGKTVSWDGETRTIALTEPPYGSLVTDADSFVQQGSTMPSVPSSGAGTGTGQAIRPGQPEDIITQAEARAAALDHAGLRETQVTFVREKLERDDGRWVYEVEFYTDDYSEYDYDIDALAGAVLSFDYDAEDYRPAARPSGEGSSDAVIGEQAAKEAALKAAGVTEGQVSRLRLELERDDGRWEYTVEFTVGTREYEYEIDAVTGDVLSWDAESIYD